MFLLRVRCYTEIMNLHIIQSAFTVTSVIQFNAYTLGNSEGMLISCPIDLI